MISGKPGTGKSQLALDLLAQVARQGVRFVFFDLKGELEDDPQNPKQRATRDEFLKLTGAKYVRLIQESLPINPLLCDENTNQNAPIAYEIAALIRCFAPQLGAKQERAIAEAYQALSAPSFAGLADELEGMDAQGVGAALIHKIVRFNLFASAQNAMSPDEWLQSSLVIDFKGFGNDTSTKSLAVALILNFLMKRMNQALPVENGVQPLKCVLFVDEAHLLLPKEGKSGLLGSLARQGRSWGFPVWLASQDADAFFTTGLETMQQTLLIWRDAVFIFPLKRSMPLHSGRFWVSCRLIFRRKARRCCEVRMNDLRLARCVNSGAIKEGEHRQNPAFALAPPIRFRRPTASPILPHFRSPSSAQEPKNKAGFSKIDMKQISSLLAAVALLCGAGMANGQESEEVWWVRWEKEKAEQGNVEAQFLLGVMYRLGGGVPKVQKNYAEAMKWFRKAAEQGDAMAQYMLGLMYFRGEGVPKNYVEAAKWFRKAAEQGDGRAQEKLGLMYDEGDGVPKNYVEAAKWFRKAAEQGWNVKRYRRAAEQGDAEAQHNLGVMYRGGYGVPKDEVEGYAWLLLAKANGIKESSEKISDLEKRLTAKQMEKGQARALELHRLYGKQSER